VSAARGTGAKALRLTVALGAVGVVWLLVLPWAAERPKVQERIKWLEAEGIDPAAMYYTELEMMQPIFNRMAMERREVAPAALENGEGRK